MTCRPLSPSRAITCGRVIQGVRISRMHPDYHRYGENKSFEMVSLNYYRFCLESRRMGGLVEEVLEDGQNEEDDEEKIKLSPQPFVGDDEDDVLKKTTRVCNARFLYSMQRGI